MNFCKFHTLFPRMQRCMTRDPKLYGMASLVLSLSTVSRNSIRVKLNCSFKVEVEQTEGIMRMFVKRELAGSCKWCFRGRPVYTAVCCVELYGKYSAKILNSWRII